MENAFLVMMRNASRRLMTLVQFHFVDRDDQPLTDLLDLDLSLQSVQNALNNNVILYIKMTYSTRSQRGHVQIGLSLLHVGTGSKNTRVKVNLIPV